MKSQRIPYACLLGIFALVLFPTLAAAAVTIEGTVTDGDPGAAIPQLQGVEVQIGTAANPLAYGSSITDATGTYTATGIPAGAIRLTFVLAGYVDTFGDYVVADGGFLVANAALAPEPVNPADTGTITGDFVDATNGTIHIQGIELRLCGGINQLTCTDYGPEVTDANGEFTFAGVTPGTYTLRATDPAGNYNDTSFQVVAVGTQTTNYPSRTMNPVLAAGEIRIILTWGQRPTDLDSHLYTPDISGTSYHVYWASLGNLSNPPYAELEWDDVTSYGPETIRISQSFTGSYEYKVHNYSGNASWPLDQSEAEVEVYDSTGQIAHFRVPRESRLSDPEEWWVFTYEYDGVNGRIIAHDSPNLGGTFIDDGNSSSDNVPGASACFIGITADSFYKQALWDTLQAGFKKMFF